MSYFNWGERDRLWLDDPKQIQYYGYKERTQYRFLWFKVKIFTF